MPSLSAIKPLTGFALVLALVSTYYEWYWPWGLLFIYWAIPSLASGEAFFVERIRRAAHPVYFWLINVMWVGFGVWTVYADLAWRLS